MGRCARGTPDRVARGDAVSDDLLALLADFPALDEQGGTLFVKGDDRGVANLFDVPETDVPEADALILFAFLFVEAADTPDVSGRDVRGGSGPCGGRRSDRRHACLFESRRESISTRASLAVRAKVDAAPDVG